MPVQTWFTGLSQLSPIWLKRARKTLICSSTHFETDPLSALIISRAQKKKRSLELVAPRFHFNIKTRFLKPPSLPEFFSKKTRTEASYVPYSTLKFLSIMSVSCWWWWWEGGFHSRAPFGFEPTQARWFELLQTCLFSWAVFKKYIYFVTR